MITQTKRQKNLPPLSLGSPLSTLPKSNETLPNNELLLSNTDQVHGEALLSQAAAEPTLDHYLDRSPKLNTEQDYEEMVKLLQKKRALFIAAEQKRKEPKIEGEEQDAVSEEA